MSCDINVHILLFSVNKLMVFKTKKSKSKVGNTGGPGRPTGTFSALDEKEKCEYYKDAVYKHRFGSPRPNDNVLGSSSSGSDHDESPRIGRPPLNLVAMSPNKLRVRMSFLNSRNFYGLH